MVKKKSSRKARKPPRKLIRKKAPRKNKERGPSGKKKTSKVRKILKWLRLGR
ncbi:MAG: hypothetical protein PHQ80_01960 [Candidatus ainarchaeum sp.]|nr:hypothetical protein [Candidatus ainarchaeum sp.]MDD5096156.1 hypothetical protein [Candidatus ainarchaeum sp.]